MKIISLKWIFAAVMLLFLHVQSNATSKLSSSVTSHTEDVAYFDESEIYNYFNNVDELVNAISTDEEISYNQLMAEKPELLNHVSSTTTSFVGQEEKSLLVVPAFFYGCLFSALGILVVSSVTNNDPALVRQAVTGCIITTIALPIVYTILSVFVYAYS